LRFAYAAPDADVEEIFMSDVPKTVAAQTLLARTPVVVVDLDISFWRLVLFFVKASLAAIPAAIITGFILMLIAIIVRGLFGFGWGNMMGMHI